VSVLQQGGAVALPSRGLVHSRTIESILKATNYRWPLFFTHELPPGDAQNGVVRAALRESPAEWLLLVEEDNTVPCNLLTGLANTHDNVQVLDYPLDGGNCAVVPDGVGGVLHAGLGCMLVRQAVFERLDWPWFAVRGFRAYRDGGRKFLEPARIADGRGADVYFSWNLQQAGETIVRIPGEAGHWRVRDYRKGKPHRIEAL